MDESLLAWIAAIESGFAQPGDWVAWADRQIGRLDEPPGWVLDLALAHSAKDALSVLWPVCSRVPPVLWDRLDLTGLFLGCLFLRFERGDLTMRDLLLQAGMKADSSNFRIECETFFLLVNEIDGGGPTVWSTCPLGQRVTELFGPFAQAARQVWFRLRSESAEHVAVAESPRD
jgi:hypothetical protein